MFCLAFSGHQNSIRRSSEHDLAVAVQPVRVPEDLSEVSSCSEIPLDLKSGPIGLHLLLEPYAFQHSETNLASHHMNICEHGLTPRCREGFYVLGSNAGISIIKINDQVAKVNADLLVWVGEVCQHCNVGI